MSEKKSEVEADRNVWQGFHRGFRGRCPSCGDAKLFSSYLKVHSSCLQCGLDLSQFRADDGPAYFTILIIGHALIAPLLFVEAVRTWPIEVISSVMVGAIITATILLLPRVKGAFVGVQWAVRDQGGG